MLSLRETQLQFAAAVLEGGGSEYAIYRNNVFSGLTAALANTYPVVEKLVGEGFFRSAARQFLARYPSRSGNLDDLGADFAGFLRAFPPAHALAYLPDVAWLEWTCHRVLLAADHGPLDLAALAKVETDAYPALRFRIHPAVSFYASEWPVHRIWQVNQPGWNADTVVDLSLGAVKLAVKRAGHRIELLPLARGEWEFACAFAGGLSFAEACARALRAAPQFDPGAAMHKLVVEQIIASFR